MMSYVAKVISLVSRLSARLGSSLAWYLWSHPHGRPNTRLPVDAAPFSLAVFDHDLHGFTLGRGEPVLLLHGWGGASADMAPLAAAVAEAGFRAVVPDLPGHGSDRGSYADVFQMAATVDAVSNLYGLPVAVVAHSFGAVVAFASFPQGGPERVVLIAPAIEGARFLDVFRIQVGLSDKAFVRFYDRFRRFAGPHLMDVLAGRGDVPRAEMLILHDPEDDRTPFDAAADYAACRSATALIEVPGAGHKGILRDRTALSETVAFLVS
jgi:pimeloyl-ACP methyl ester carboxylesterase